jgi:shikimate dehydrogenase
VSAAARIRGASRVTGIIGWPVSHSLSPVMHNEAYRALGLDYVYVPFPVRPEDLAPAVAGLRALQIVGANVTIPHKVAVLPLLDTLTKEAELVGAVNTIVRTQGGRLEGHNTDGPGFLAALREEASLDPEGIRAIVIGSGGSGRAVAVSLALAGALSVTITNRTPGRAEALCSEMSEKLRGATFQPIEFTPRALRQAFAQSDLVVNCTAVGMRGEPFELEIPLPDLPDHAVVADVVYSSSGTPLVLQAAAVGRRSFGGLGMLVHQGAIAQEMWTGVRPPVSVMAEAVRAALVRS